MKKLNRKKLCTALEREINSNLTEHIYAGVHLAVVQNGETLADYAKGLRNSEEGTPMTGNELYRFCSMTKPVTAVGIIIQIVNGKINLNDRISEYLPYFAHKHLGIECGDRIVDGGEVEDFTLMHLLTHTSGMMADDNISYRQEFSLEQLGTLQNVVKYYGEKFLLSNPPMKKAWYSSLAAFDIIARLIEVTSDMPYEDFMKKYIFDPLDMCDATFYPNEEQWLRMIALHERVEQNEISHNAVNHKIGRQIMNGFPLTYTSGSGSLCGTMCDYMNFAMMLRSGGQLNGIRILPEKWVEEIRYPRIPDTVPGISKDETWGLGVRVTTGNPILGTGCYGWSGAYGSHFWVDPTNDIVAILLKNSCYDGGSPALTSRRFERCVMFSLED